MGGCARIEEGVGKNGPLFARSGRLADARLTFEKMLTYANCVGLYAEEIGLTGERLGDFPQAFTHLALINAAINLDCQLDHGAGRPGVRS